MSGILAALTLPQIIGALSGISGIVGSGVQAFKKHPNHGAAFDKFTDPATNLNRFMPLIANQNKFNMSNAGRIAEGAGYSPFIAGLQASQMNRQVMDDAYNNYMPMANQMAMQATEMKANADFNRFENDQKSKLSFFNQIANMGLGLATSWDGGQGKTLGNLMDDIRYPQLKAQSQETEGFVKNWIRPTMDAVTPIGNTGSRQPDMGFNRGNLMFTNPESSIDRSGASQFPSTPMNSSFLRNNSNVNNNRLFNQGGFNHKGKDNGNDFLSFFKNNKLLNNGLY
jgi:hypothetical protein